MRVWSELKAFLSFSCDFGNHSLLAETNKLVIIEYVVQHLYFVNISISRYLWVSRS